MINKAIVIGAGDSINDDTLSKIEGMKKYISSVAIMSSDRTLKRVLDMGITPKFFPKYFTCITENLIREDLGIDFFKEFFEHKIVREYAYGITVFTSGVFDRFEELHDIGFKENIDFGRIGKKGRTLSLDSPVIQNCGNNVMGMIGMARRIGINKIATIGFDMDYSGSFKDGKHDPINEYELTKKELFQLYLDYEKPIYNLTRKGKIHGKGVVDINVEDFLNDC